MPRASAEPRLRRLVPLLLVLTLLGSACARIEEEVDERVPDELQEPGERAPDGQEQPDTGAGSVAADDRGPLGANAGLYLSGEVGALEVEVDAVQGAEPSDGALDHMTSVLGSVADKPAGIELRRSGTFGSSGGDYSIEDMRALEAQHREGASDGETASMYVLALDGSFAEDEGALGVAYSASAFAVFIDRIAAAGGPLASSEPIERGVLVHEVGHILRLVNIGYTSPRDHEDPEHPNHSSNEDSVMHWAVEADVVSQVLGGPPPDDFDDDDRADLEAIKAGRLP